MAISPKEVMRGIILNYEGKPVIVKGVTEYIILEGRKEWIGGSLINGEPISEIWLEKLGFEQTEYDTYSKGELKITLGDSCFYSNKSMTEYNYVHQLQLLYFSLTQEHLKLPKLK